MCPPPPTPRPLQSHSSVFRVFQCLLCTGTGPVLGLSDEHTDLATELVVIWGEGGSAGGGMVVGRQRERRAHIVTDQTAIPVSSLSEEYGL